MMDRFVRQAAIRAATASSRRDFLSHMLRGLAGAGMGVGLLFGSGRYAFATGVNKCQYHSTPDPGAACNGKTRCSGRDANTKGSEKPNQVDASGCGGLPRCEKPDPNDPTGVNMISDCGAMGACGGANPTSRGFWICCCSGKLSTCRDCAPGATDFPVCICQFTDPNSKCGS